MQFVRDDRSIPLSMWGTDSMLEYFQALATLGDDMTACHHGFQPAWAQVVVMPRNVGVSGELRGSEAANETLGEIIALLESLPVEYQRWGNAMSVVADEFGHELSIHIDTEVAVEEVHTLVSVMEPTELHKDMSMRLLLDDSFELDETDRHDIKAVLDYDLNVREDVLSMTLSQLLVIRGYLADAMEHGRVFCTTNDDDEGTPDGWVHFVDMVEWGSRWPARGIEGRVSLLTSWPGDVETSRLHKWSFAGEMRDSKVPGRVSYSFDLVFSDGVEEHVVRSGFVSGVIGVPAWWDECFVYEE